MNITPVDAHNNLFRVENVFTQDLVTQILATDWLSLPWKREDLQETWKRRKIISSSIPWIAEFDRQLAAHWPIFNEEFGVNLFPYSSTAFWIDEPGFTVSMHTDGTLPMAMQLTWAAEDPNLGTSFYWGNDPSTLRFQTPFVPNAGYLMINDKPDSRLLWHAMLTPVPEGTIRVCSYTVMWEFD